MKAERIPWVAVMGLAGAGSGALGLRLLQGGLLRLPPCPLKGLTGVPCLTCGLTRWAVALGGGDWRGAFHWHPVACVLLGLAPLAMLWDVRRAWMGRPYPELPQSPWARGAALAILLGTWALQAVRGI